MSNKLHMGLLDNLAALKEKQKAAVDEKAEQVAQAEVEQAKAEKKEGLQAEREAVATELATAEVAASEADEAIASAEAFAAEAGEDLEPDVAEGLAGIVAEANQAKEKFVDLQAEVARIDKELALLEDSGAIEDEDAEGAEERGVVEEDQGEAETSELSAEDKLDAKFENKKAKAISGATSSIDNSEDIPDEWKQRLKEDLTKRLTADNTAGFGNEPQVYQAQDSRKGTTITYGRDTMKEEFVQEAKGNFVFLPEFAGIVQPEITGLYNEIRQTDDGASRGDLAGKMFDMVQDLVSSAEYQATRKAIERIKGDAQSKRLDARNEHHRAIRMLELDKKQDAG